MINISITNPKIYMYVHYCKHQGLFFTSTVSLRVPIQFLLKEIIEEFMLISLNFFKKSTVHTM